MENIILTNNKDLRLVSVKVGVLSTLRFELPLVSASATHVEVIVTSGNVHSAYTATFIDATKRWQCDIAASQFPTVGRQSYEVAYVLDGKQFWDGKGWIEIEDATTSGIEPQPRPEPYRYAVVSVNGYGADSQGAVRIPKTFIAANSPETTEGYMEGDIYFNRETGATWTLCNVQSTLTWVFNYKNYYTKAETEEAIDRVAAYYITYDAAGNPFPTYAALANATTVYSGGSVRIPTRNDYCVVLADETHGGAEYRYIYAVAEGEATGSWQPQFPVEGVMTVDQSVTKDSQNPVSGGGVWSALWGALSALPTGFSSLYDWCVAQIAKLRDKLDLNVYSRGNALVTFPDGFSITYMDDTYVASSGGETIEFYGPITSTAVPQYNFWVPYAYKDATDFDPQAQIVWCLYGGEAPHSLMYGTGASYAIDNWNTESPTLTLSNGEESGGHPTMARPLGATGDTLVKMSQMNTALANKQNALSQTQLANIAAVSDALAFDATHSYSAGDPVVYNGTLYTFTATHTGAWTGSDVSAVDIIARLALKANDNAVVKLTGDQTIGGNKTFTGTDNFYDFTVSHPQGQGYVRIYALANENRVRIEFLDAVSGSQGGLFLPVLGAYSAVTLAAIENLAPDAFLMLYDGATVDLNTLYCYQGRLYRCILGYTFQSGDSYPPDDTTHWTPATVEDVLAALRTAIAGKADVSAIPYALVTKTITNGAVSLDDRASNSVTVSATLSPNTLTVNFPTATSGKVRDFAMRLNIAAGVTAPEIAWPQGVTLENDGGEVPEIADGGTGGSSTILYFSETENNGTTAKFLVKGEALTAITQA